MKNKILQITKLIFFIINLFFISSLIYADEFEIEALKIEYDNKNEKLLATGDVVAKSNDGLIINAQEVTYNKKNNTLEAKKSVVIKDESSNSEIRGENILLDNEKEKILSFGKTFIYFKDNYNIVTSDIIFDRNKNTIRSNNLTSGLDKEGNKLTLDNFVYHIQNYKHYH
jgi:lipopolysaccharide assembly outer membrane protein LptD (OstA)